jgi:hypothetical protein
MKKEQRETTRCSFLRRVYGTMDAPDVNWKIEAM